MKPSKRQETQAAEEGCEKMKGSPCFPSGDITCKYPWNARYI